MRYAFVLSLSLHLALFYLYWTQNTYRKDVAMLKVSVESHDAFPKSAKPLQPRGESTSLNTRQLSSDIVESWQKELYNSLRYPPRAKALGWEDSLRVLVVVGKDKRLQKLIFLEKSQYDDFNKAVEEALMKWSFPFPEGSEIALSFRFELEKE
ncbi:MAG: TonB family protein [Leptospiraceae bacterium]|nr:TonB family protein [Leptospiraceae bacterium]MDW8307172.1 TonB family protein [Leptospiraceae bacterium]